MHSYFTLLYVSIIISAIDSQVVHHNYKKRMNGAKPRRRLMGPAIVKAVNSEFITSFAPQISDPRIELQTYNAPNAPVLPNILPKPKVNVDMIMPKDTMKVTPPITEIHQKVVPESPEDKIDAGIVKNLKDEFLHFLKKHDNRFESHYASGTGVSVGMNKPGYKTSFIFLPEERMAREIVAENKIDTIMEKIDRISQNYKQYKAGIKKRMQSLAFIIDYVKKKEMHLILGENADKFI